MIWGGGGLYCNCGNEMIPLSNSSESEMVPHMGASIFCTVTPVVKSEPNTLELYDLKVPSRITLNIQYINQTAKRMVQKAIFCCCTCDYSLRSLISFGRRYLGRFPAKLAFMGGLSEDFLQVLCLVGSLTVNITITAWQRVRLFLRSR